MFLSILGLVFIYITIFIDIELYPLKMLSLVQCVYIYIYVYVFPSIAFFQRTLSHINGSPWIQYSDKDSRMKSLNIYLSSSWNRVSSSHHGWFKTKSCSNDLDDLPCPKLIEICKYTHTYITLYSIPFHYIHTYIYVHTYVYVHMYTYIYT